jgi:hypothetical protein
MPQLWIILMVHRNAYSWFFCALDVTLFVMAAGYFDACNSVLFKPSED